MQNKSSSDSDALSSYFDHIHVRLLSENRVLIRNPPHCVQVVAPRAHCACSVRGGGGFCSLCSIRELQNYHWQPKRNFSPGKVKSSRGLGQNIVLVFQLKFIERKANPLPGRTRRRSAVIWRGPVRGRSSFCRVWSTFWDGRKVGDES